MDFKLTPEQEKLKQDVREFLKREVTEEVLRESHGGQGVGPASRALLRKMGARGWLTPAWPKEYGGLGLTNLEKHIINEELAYHSAPHGLVSTSMAGPTIRIYGSEEQKKEWLPRIASGEIHFALGYTEPQAGSDLAALEIKGVEDGDDFVVSGQK
ncbi:MAG: acyl-CoA dehydrogenase family protein, partial [Chloroflexota bacterium]|nr:acyl-CoA dehydrogenase family protein [Chloroflexota bacterium]